MKGKANAIVCNLLFLTDIWYHTSHQQSKIKKIRVCFFLRWWGHRQTLVQNNWLRKNRRREKNRTTASNKMLQQWSQGTGKIRYIPLFRPYRLDHRQAFIWPEKHFNVSSAVSDGNGQVEHISDYSVTFWWPVHPLHIPGVCEEKTSFKLAFSRATLKMCLWRS